MFLRFHESFRQGRPMSESGDQKKHQDFLGLFTKGKEFTEELLKENERLRYRIASLEEQLAKPSSGKPDVEQQMGRLEQRIAELAAENERLVARYRAVEEENKDFANRYIEIEEQNNNLANLYVASYQLHSTLDFREVLQVVQEIIINLVGAEIFGLLLLDEKTNDLRCVAHEGSEVMNGLTSMSVRLGDGIIGEVARTGESYFLNQGTGVEIDLLHPVAAIPLKIKEHVIGVIVIHKLLQQKDSFSAVDYELFSLLAGHAATAIFSAKLYSQSERKLSTIQSFLDLLTTN
jgi:transcriptional regulator with GAF, ATPase, and Fis domain